MHQNDDKRAQTAREALDRVRRDSETVGSSSMARAASEQAKSWADHFAAKDAIGQAEGGGTDPAELWGRRIGRALSALGVLVLAYLLGRQLKFW